MSSESSHSDSESSVDIEDIEDDLYAIEEAKLRNQERPTINDVQGLEQKLEEIKLRISGYEPDQIPWSEVLVLTSDKSTQEILDDADDDLKRERVFYDQAVEAIVSGLQKLRQEGVPFERPDDYYAEMMKTDEHMKKIKGVLLKEKRQIDEAVERRKNRTNKKFAKQLQIKKKEQRKAEKDAELDAVKQWRKNQKRSGGGDFPEELLDPKSQIRKGFQSRKPSAKAAAKAAKYGFGGKKRDLKKTTSESSGDFSEFNSRRNRAVEFQKGTSKGKRPTPAGNRPGKRRRQQQGAGGPAKKARR